MSREIDARVAREVMGLTVNPDGMSLPCDDGYRKLPHYSTDMNAALEVVKKMRGLGWGNILIEQSEILGDSWYVAIINRSRGVYHACDGEKSLPLAICLAALKVVADK